MFGVGEFFGDSKAVRGAVKKTVAKVMLAMLGICGAIVAMLGICGAMQVEVTLRCRSRTRGDSSVRNTATALRKRGWSTTYIGADLCVQLVDEIINLWVGGWVSG